MRPTPTIPTAAGLERRAFSSARYTVDLEASKPGATMAASLIVRFLGDDEFPEVGRKRVEKISVFRG
jgi:hypothetical protein